MRRLIVSVGGGGDVVTATAFARPSFDVVVSLVWEKLSFDPHPGPRMPSELLRLSMIEFGIGRVSANSSLPNGRPLSQALLTSAFPDVIQYVLDPSQGVRGIRDALNFLCDALDIDEVWGVDVGGDALVGQPSPSLTSPLIDALFLGAMSAVERPAFLVVFGLGLDGEVEIDQLTAIIDRSFDQGNVVGVHTVSMHAVDVAASILKSGTLSSEVNALFIWSYKGMRGKVLFRDAGTTALVDSSVMIGYQLPIDYVCRCCNELPYQISDLGTLLEVNSFLLRNRFRSELQDQIDIVEGREIEAAIRKGLRPFADVVQEIPHDIKYVARRYLERRVQGDKNEVSLQISASAHFVDVGFTPFLALIR